MAFREVSVFEIKEVLRLWLRGEGYRAIDRLSGVDRKTVRRYVEAAVAAGLSADGGEEQLSDVVIGQVCERVRPARPAGHGAGWESVVPHEAEIKAWLEKGLKLVKVRDLLARKGVVVAYRTLNRFATERCGFGERKTTVRVNDGEPGSELQVDFGRMGLVPDPAGGGQRVVQALIFTACYSRHCFVWLSHRQTTAAVIEGFEAAWAFFGGVFAVVIPDSMAAIVDEADAVAPRFNAAFLEYAQSRGFVIDPARVRSPKDKPKVERQVQYVRGSYFAGESFADLADAQRRATTLLDDGRPAHARHHPVQAPRGVPRRGGARAAARTHRGLRPPALRHSEGASRPPHRGGQGAVLHSRQLIGFRVNARADAAVVKVFHRGQLIKVHPRQRPGGRRTDAADLPTGTEIYAMRDIDALKRMAAGHGQAVGAYAAALLDSPLPWTRMRQVYRLLGLAKKWGDERVEAACARAAEAEAVDVGLIGRMLERATEAAPPPALPGLAKVIPGRFCRDASEFATGEGARS